MATPPGRDPFPANAPPDPHQRAADTRRRVLDAALTLKSYDTTTIDDDDAAYRGGTAYPQMRGTTPAQAVDRFLVLLQDRLPAWLRVLHDLMHRAGKGDLAANLLPVARAAIDYYAEVQAAALPAFLSPSVTVRFREALRENELGPEAELQPLAAYLAAEQELGRVSAAVDPLASARLLLAGCFRHAYYEMFVGPDSGPPRDAAASEIVGELRLSVA